MLRSLMAAFKSLRKLEPHRVSLPDLEESLRQFEEYCRRLKKLEEIRGSLRHI